MAINQLPISADRFAELADDPQYRDQRVELVNGEIITMPKPKRLHGFVSHRIVRYLDRYAEEHNGTLYINETGIVTVERQDGRDTVRGVDVAYYKEDDDNFNQFMRKAPDVAVEVLSPGNEAIDIDDKVAEYLAMGVPLVWIVNPKLRTVTAYYPGNQLHRYGSDDILEAGDVLPGFAVPVKALFPSTVPVADDETADDDA